MPKSWFFTLFAALVLFSACKGGDEEAKDYTPLLALLQINTIEGVHYEGKAIRGHCDDAPFYRYCEVQKRGEELIEASSPENARFILSIVDNQVRLESHLILSHLDGSTYIYDANLTGSTVDTSDGKKMIQVDPKSGVRSLESADRIIDIRDMKLLFDKETITGSMTLHYFTPASSDFADTEYSLDLRKKL